MHACESQVRAVHSLRRRLGEVLHPDTATPREAKPACSSAGGAAAGSAVAGAAGGLAGGLSIGLAESGASPGSPTSPGSKARAALLRGATRHAVALERDARDGTLGIDLDQFEGLPTVAGRPRTWRTPTPCTSHSVHC